VLGIVTAPGAGAAVAPDRAHTIATVDGRASTYDRDVNEAETLTDSLALTSIWATGAAGRQRPGRPIRSRGRAHHSPIDVAGRCVRSET